MTTPPSSHFEAALQRDSDQIRTKVLEMAALDEQALTRAFQALVKRDRQMAYSVILRDQDVDALETELDRLCLEFIVRHQPAAGHLRFVYSASKIVNELERVGDYAESIARQVLLLSSLPFDIPIDDVQRDRRTSRSRCCTTRCGPSWTRTPIWRGRRWRPSRASTRSGTRSARSWWSGAEAGRLPLEALPPLITVARRFERVSDQATNICEEALYFATGEYLRHLPRRASGCSSWTRPTGA